MKTAAKIRLYNKDTLTEDFDLTLKLFKSGGNIEFVPDAIAWTYCPSTWKG
jgi:cellulose synthase/poly-beta-1,6-N-acetylglucosamine synthase-like glycosyltransferase